MKVKLENGNENTIKIDIIIPAKEAADAYNQAVKNIAQYVNIDGFRKGKAPRAVVERHVGVEKIKHEAIERLLPKAISKAIADNKLDVITQPYITSYHFNLGEDLQVAAQAELRPEVTLGQYKDLTINVEDAKIPDDALDKSIGSLLNHHSTFELVTDRPANATDTVVVDFEGFSNGEKIKGGDSKNYTLDLGHSNFISGFAEQIAGHNLHEEFDINVTFPEEYHDEKLKGQPAVFKIKINEIKERIIPELNDEFAQKAGNFNTVDELKADIQKYLENQRERSNKINFENELFKTIVETSSVEISQKMIDRESSALMKEYKQRLEAQGLTWENVVKAQGEEEILKNIRNDAAVRIKNSLVIDKIAKEENIRLTQTDLEKQIYKISAAYGVDPQDFVKKFGKSSEFLSLISQQAMNDKVKSFLAANNKAEFKTSAPKNKKVDTKKK